MVVEPSGSQSQSVQQQSAVITDIDVDRSASVCIFDQLKACTVEKTVSRLCNFLM